MNAWSNRRVAVTGAAGFLGSHLCEALVSEGAAVLALDNFEGGSARNLEAVRARLRLLNCDIACADTDDALREAEAVFHLAAMANPRACQKDFARTYRVNVEGTRRVLEACRPGARVIFLSGAMIYGEPRALPIDETHAPGARDAYALSKIMGECLTWAVASARGLRATVVRNFSSYGPRQSPDYVIPGMIRRALRSGRIELWNATPTRDFTYVTDTIQALLAIAKSEALVGEAVNVGSGTERSIHEVARTVAALLGNVQVHDLGQEVTGSQRQCADNRKLRRATGWGPRVALEDGLARTIAWAKQETAEPAREENKSLPVSPTWAAGGVR